MTWEQTIQYIRTQPEFKELVEKAYFEEDLAVNVERFAASEEFDETLALLKRYSPAAKTILDIGSGNGISAIAFALNGYEVTVSEPDRSDTIGAGAVRKLKSIYRIDKLDVHERFAEDIDFRDQLFDIVYVRQAMHHAHDLQKFIKNLARLIKPGGYLFTVRDHVIYDDADKQWFLNTHPLQKFYGGENAFTSEQYTHAMQAAGLTICQQLKHYDSVINYFPMTREQVNELPRQKELELEEALKNKIGMLSSFPGVKWLYKKRVGFSLRAVLDERKIPGRMYSFIAHKK